MTSSAFTTLLQDVSPRWTGHVNQAWSQKPMTIAVINSMPDAALRATERQYCLLLGPASSGLTVKLKFYTLPGVRRSAAVQAHIDAHYDDFRSLDDDPPDGLIMTGTEPTAPCLKEESFWPSMAHVINLCHDRGIPAIYSCLAAHAAVLEIDGIPRVRLPKKLSGAFECRVDTGKHHIFHRLPERWVVPHSRLNGLRRVDLERNGYDVVSGSSEVGVDVFMKRCECVQLFLQGHPEYDIGTLAAEYRRDVLRAFRGQQAYIPDLPRGLGARSSRLAGHSIARAVRARDELEMLAGLETITPSLRPKLSWAENARKLYANWLTYVDARRERQLAKRSLNAS
jgi:homoserine O-succinyltransferase